jgi:hypothetical protein
MDRYPNPPLEVLKPFLGQWQQTARIGEQTMLVAITSFRRLGHGGLVVQRTDPPTHLAPEWAGAAPRWVEAVFGRDDHSGEFTMLYTDSRGVGRRYSMGFDGRRWTLTARAGTEFHQRFEATFGGDGQTIAGRWDASADGRSWSTDFDIVYRRIPLTGAAI